MVSKETVKAIGNYSVGDYIGRGAYAKVYKGLNTETAQIVAIKQVALNQISDDNLNAIKTEINILKKLKHKNIVKYIDAIYSNTSLSIILEYVESGALSAIMKKFGPFPEKLVAIYIKQVLTGLQYLHSQNVVHRDIKGANILTTKDGVVKLADFGVAKQFSETTKSSSVVGTPYWMAPEIVNIEEQTAATTFAWDIWSLGATIIELLTGNPPYYDLMPFQAMYRIVTDEHPDLPNNIPPDLEDFLLKWFAKVPIMRLDATQALQHPWLSEVKVTATEDDSFGIEPALPIRNRLEFLEPTMPDRNRLEFLNLSDVLHNDDQDEEMAIEVNSSDIDIWNINRASSPGGHRRWENATNRTFEESIRESLDTDRKMLANMSKQELKTSPRIYDPRINMETAILSMHETHSQPKPNIPPLRLAFGESHTSPPTDENTLDEKFARSDPAIQTERSWDSSLTQVVDLNSDNMLSSELTPRQLTSILQLQVLQELQHISENLNIDSPNLISDIQYISLKLKDHPDFKDQLSHAMVVVKHMLEISEDPLLQESCLELINEIIKDSQKLKEMSCLLGVAPVVMKYAGEEWTIDVRREVAYYLGQIYQSDRIITLAMSSGSVDALPKLIDYDYEENGDIIKVALDCMMKHVAGRFPNWHKIWMSASLIERLLIVALNAILDNGDEGNQILAKVWGLMIYFSKLEKEVKLRIWDQQNMDILIAALDQAHVTQLGKILKIFQHLSKEPSTLEYLEKYGLIQNLVQILQTEYDVDAQSIQSAAIKTLSNLCKLSPSRQEKAALAGGISAIHGCISQRKNLRVIGVPLLCCFSLASATSRDKLKRMGGLQMLIDLMTTDIGGKVLESISTWCSEDPEYCDAILWSKENISKLMKVFKQVSDSIFEHTLQWYVTLIEMSENLSYKFAHNDEFIMTLIDKLGFKTWTYKQKHPNVIYIGMNMLYQLCRRHKNKRQLFDQHDLYSIIVNILHETNCDDMVVLEEIASRLLHLYSN